MSMLLSVVLPTHNRAGDLERAAASVLAQEVSEAELVVVDDASTDDTPQALDRIADKDKRVRIVRSESQLGPCAARNLGLERAGGGFVGFCDDDDTWLPDAGRTLVEFLGDHPETGAVSSWHQVSHSGLARSVPFRGPLRYGSEHLLWQNLVAVPFGIIRRSLLSFDVRFDPGLPTGEDWDLWLRCAQERPMQTLPHVSYVYTQHGGARVTRALVAQIDGRRGFLAKHGAAMSPACRLYHRSVVAGYELGRSGMTKALVSGEGSRLDKAFVASVLACSLGASRIGQRRDDPGLQARLMASVVGRARLGAWNP